MKILTKDTLPIKGTFAYRKAADGSYIYSTRFHRKLKRRWTTKGYYTMLYLENGKQLQFYHQWDSLPAPAEDVLPKEAKPIPDYPAYYITPYGGVWRCSNRRTERPILLSEHERHGRPYVQIKNKFGKRHNKRVDKLVEEVFGVTLES